MSLPTPLLLRGVPGSPYTRKMVALLRYRHIPYRLLIGNATDGTDLPKPKVPLLPTFYLPDATGTLQAVTDSTPLIRRFEEAFAGRSVIPEDPALAFLDALLEDYGDEWLTKAMFHYRWAYADDITKAGSILPRWTFLLSPEAEARQMGQLFSERQISRLYVVGSNEQTGPLIESSYKRFLDLFRTHLEGGHAFFLGNRPAASDFAAFGQLTQLAAFDPTPMAETLTRAPRVAAWVDIVDDLTGLEPQPDHWISRDAIPDSLRALLKEVGRVYVPVMLANAAAVATGAERVETQVDGTPWVQHPFPYQAKCVRWLREHYAALAPDDRRAVDAALAGTGCEPFVKP